MPRGKQENPKTKAIAITTRRYYSLICIPGLAPRLCNRSNREFSVCELVGHLVWLTVELLNACQFEGICECSKGFTHP